MKQDRSRVILDTNTLVSALIRLDSIPAMAVRMALEACDVFVSSETLDEFERVMFRGKFDRYFAPAETTREQFIAFYKLKVIVADVTTISTDCTDPSDNKFLSLAVSVMPISLLQAIRRI